MVASDGSEGIGLYEKAAEEERPFDLVIMDLTIQGGTGGREAIKELKRVDPAAKVIVSSGYFDDPIMSNFEQYGFSGVAPNPYRIEDLAQAIQEILGKAGQ